MYRIIINPCSGRGLPLKKLPEIEAFLKERALQYQICYAQTPEDATKFAAEAGAAQVDGIIAIGGDGTLFQIINGLAGSDVPLIFAPCGTGNDFIKSLNLPHDPIEALKLQLDSPVRRIDVGRMNDTYFLNVAGTGFDVDVLRFAESHKKKYSGLKPYLLGLAQALKAYRPTTACISFDGGPEETARFAIVSIGNGRYIGGGMKAVPDALVDDGYFDVVTVSPVSKFVILPLIAFYIAGKHISLRLASVRRCKKLTLRCKNMTLNLDGELRNTDTAQFELYPALLRVRVPK